MANQKRQRQRARKTANPYGTSPAENPYATAPGATQQVPGTSNAGPTPDQATPGMKDDMGDGTPPGKSNAGMNGQAMANKVALHCFGCGAEGWVGLDKVARIGEDGKQLTCQVCKSTDLDVLDRDPVVSARQLLAMQRQAIWPQPIPSPTYRECAECGEETSNTSGLCSKCRKSYEDEAEENERESKESSLRTQRLAGLLVTAAQRCDNCGHTIKSNVPNEQGWECPKCHQGSMQDTKESAHTAADTKTCEQCHAKPAEGYAMGPKSGDWGGNYCASCAEKLGWPLEPYQKESALGAAYHQAFSEPPMGHLTSNPTPEEIMAKADAIPLPIKRLPPRQQQQTAQVVSAILGTNPGLNRTLAWKVAFRTVTGLDA